MTEEDDFITHDPEIILKEPKSSSRSYTSAEMNEDSIQISRCKSEGTAPNIIKEKAKNGTYKENEERHGTMRSWDKNGHH